jgi:hypothetical protein
MATMTPPRIARAQRSALVLLVFAGTLNYVDRATLSGTRGKSPGAQAGAERNLTRSGR